MSGKDAAKAKGPAQEQKKKGNYQKWHRRGQTEGKKKDPEAIPALKYGPSNNFMFFKEALSNAALKEYGALGKMIKQGEEYSEPQEPDIDDYDLDDDPYGINKAKYIEDLKDYRKEINELKKNSPKLYGLITQYLSEERIIPGKGALRASSLIKSILMLPAGSIVQPKDLNAMYLLANQWLKTAKSHPTGLATTFNTTLDLQDPPQETGKAKGDRKQKAS